MSAEARANGWRGFEGIGERVERVPGIRESKGGWEYKCDGMPTLMGCGQSIVVSRRFARVGLKSTGWLVCYGLEPKTPDTKFDDPDGFEEDKDVVLTFCPECTKVVQSQEPK